MLVIFFAVAIKGWLASQWERYKARQALVPTPMKLKNGVHVPWGPVEKIRRAFNIFSYIWLAYIIALLVGLAYVKWYGITF